MPMKREDLIDSLGNLGYPIISTHKKNTKKNEITNVLNELIDLDVCCGKEIRNFFKDETNED